MLADLLPVIVCPWCGAGDLAPTRPMPRDGRIIDGGLTCPGCARVSEVRGGIWHAMGDHSPQRTLAQLANVVPPTPQLYERLWRVRSLSLLTRRRFPIGEELEMLRGALDPGPGRPMVDVACSEGLYARALAAEGSPILAVDHSLAFLRRTALRSASLPVAPVRALAQHLPVRTAALAGAAMGGSLNEIGDAPGALREMTRVLAANAHGFLMSLGPAATTRGRLLQALVRPAGIAFPTDDDLLAWLRPTTTEVHIEPREVVRLTTFRAQGDG